MAGWGKLMICWDAAKRKSSKRGCNSKILEDKFEIKRQRTFKKKTVQEKKKALSVDSSDCSAA